LGRPVITEDTGAAPYLPRESGIFFVNDALTAAEATREVMRSWSRYSRSARACATELFDSARNLRRILNL
jgi:hypothetical protein